MKLKPVAVDPNLPRQPITNSEIAGDYQWCIAGGFACCPGIARDCDVWVLGAGITENPDEIRDRILGLLGAHSVAFDEEANDPAKPLEFYDMGNGILCWKVAMLKDGRQILLTTASTPLELLGNFDVSTHQVALTSDGELIRGPKWTPPTVPPVQLREGALTNERMVKIARRYARMA